MLGGGNNQNAEIKNVNGSLEEIVRSVTSPSFCLMPWKCITMTVGEPLDPSIKKSLVHIHRTCVEGQNIFDIKVHNCRKEVCDHAICTKDCETNTQVLQRDIIEETSAQKGTHKKKRRKAKKTGESVNEEVTVGYFNTINSTKSYSEKPSLICYRENESVSKNNIADTMKKRKDPHESFDRQENKEKPSCTLQIFSEGKARKLNFQLHPAMEMFLGKALDKIEGHGGKKCSNRKKRPKTVNSDNSTRTVPPPEDSRGSRVQVVNTKSVTAPLYQGNKTKVTESVEEFEIKFGNSSDREAMMRMSNDLNNLRSNVQNKMNYGTIYITGENSVDPWQQPFSRKADHVPYICQQQDFIPNNIARSGKDASISGCHMFSTQGNPFCCGTTADNTFIGPRNSNRNRISHETETNPSNRIYAEDVDRRRTDPGQTYLQPGKSCQNNIVDISNIGATSHSRNNIMFQRNGEISNFSHIEVSDEMRHPMDTRRDIGRPMKKEQNTVLENKHSEINCCRNDIPNKNANRFQERYLNDPVHHTFASRSLDEDQLDENCKIMYPSEHIMDTLSNKGRTSQQFHYLVDSPSPVECKGPCIPHDGRRKNSCVFHRTGSTQYCRRHVYQGKKGYIEPEIKTKTVAAGDSFTDAYTRHNKKIPLVLRVNELKHANEPREERIRSRKKLERDSLDDFYATHDKRDSELDDYYKVEEIPKLVRKRPVKRRSFLFHYPNKTPKKGRKHPHDPMIVEKEDSEKEDIKKVIEETPKSKSFSSNSSYENIPPRKSSDEVRRHSTFKKSTRNNDNQGVIIVEDHRKNDKTDVKSSSKLAGTSDTRTLPLAGCYSQIKTITKQETKSPNKDSQPRKDKINKTETPRVRSKYPIAQKFKKKLPQGSEEEFFFEKEEFVKKYKFKNTGKVSREEIEKNKLNSNVRKINTENRKIAKKDMVYRKKTPRENHTVINRTLSIETSDVSDFYKVRKEEDRSRSNSVTVCYHEPGYYGPFERLNHCDYESIDHYDDHYIKKRAYDRNENNRKRIENKHYSSSREYLCYPSHVTWDYCDGIRQSNPETCLNENSSNKVVTQRHKTDGIEFSKPVNSSNYCKACSKNFHDETAEDICFNQKDETTNHEKNKLIDGTLDKEIKRSEETQWSRSHENEESTGLTIKNSCNVNSEEHKSNTMPNGGDTFNNDSGKENMGHDGLINRITNNLNKDLPNQQSPKVQRKSSILLQTENVKKFLSHAKGYLGFRKHSNSCVAESNNDNLSKVISQNSKRNLAASNEVQIKLSGHSHFDGSKKTQNPIIVYSLNETNNKTDTPYKAVSDHVHKPVSNTLIKRKSNEDKYRLYGNIGSKENCDQFLKLGNTPKFVNNEFKILQSASECDSSDDPYFSEINSQSESEKAKNWVTKGRRNRKNTKNNKLKAGLTKIKSDSSVQSEFINHYNLKMTNTDETCQVTTVPNNEPTITATIALNPSVELWNNSNEVQARHKSKMHSDLQSKKKFSSHFSDSLKSNYNKIKVIMKRNNVMHSNRSFKKGLKYTKLEYNEKIAHNASTSTMNTNENSYKYKKLRNRDTKNALGTRYLKSAKNKASSNSNFSRSESVLKKIQPRAWLKIISKKDEYRVNQSTDVCASGIHAEISHSVELEHDSEPDVTKAMSTPKSRRSKERSDKVLASGETTEYSNHNRLDESSTSNYEMDESSTSQKKERSSSVSESVANCQSKETSSTCQPGNWFQDPLIDPKTGFCPLLP